MKKRYSDLESGIYPLASVGLFISRPVERGERLQMPRGPVIFRGLAGLQSIYDEYDNFSHLKLQPAENYLTFQFLPENTLTLGSYIIK